MIPWVSVGREHVFSVAAEVLYRLQQSECVFGQWYGVRTSLLYTLRWDCRSLASTVFFLA